MKAPTGVIAVEGMRVASVMARSLAEVRGRMRRTSWLCLWLIARHALRVWIDSQ